MLLTVCILLAAFVIVVMVAQTVLSRLFPNEEPLDAAGIERLAAHVTRFSLAAMKHLPAAKL